jgi:hypothetical protein
MRSIGSAHTHGQMHITTPANVHTLLLSKPTEQYTIIITHGQAATRLQERGPQ